MSGWVKLHRSFLEFDWYDDANVVRLLLHLILTCNYEPKQCRGIQIQAGQLVTSYDKLAEALNLTPKQIRVALKKLEQGREVVRERAGKGQLVTLVKWEKMQVYENKRAGKGQNEGRKRATTKESKESKEGKNTRFHAPTIHEVVAYFKENGYTEASGRRAWEYYEAGNWKDGRGNQVKAWKQKMRGVWFKDENLINNQTEADPWANKKRV